MNDHPFRDRWNHNAHHYPTLAGIVAGRERVLDMGCGEGTLARYLRDEGHRVTGIDTDTRVLPAADEGIDYLTADARELPFPDDTFDAVVACAVLHHLDRPRALAEAARVVRPGGVVAVIDMAARSTLRDRPRDVADMVRSRLMRRGMTPWEPDTVKADPRLSWAGTRAELEAALPGVVVRHLPPWRLLAVWTRPHPS